MSLIIAENVTQAFGAHEVFRNVSFRLAAADRVGLVGPNGEGKTTLLRIIGGQLEPTFGQVHRSGGLRIGYLPQDPPAPRDRTIRDAMLDVFADVRRAERLLGELAEQMADRHDDRAFMERYDALQAEFDTAGGYGYLTRIEQVLTGLGFEPDMWDRPLAQLSGGQRTRVFLGSLLLTEPDVLMLDEPTNHLDLDSVEWLEGWLSSSRGALVVVSHDRYFLDRVTTDTWEIAFGRLEQYHGPYSQYVGKREARYQERLKQWRAQQEFIARTREFIAHHLAGQRTKEAQGRRTRLERFLRDEAIERPPENKAIHIRLDAGRRTGDFVLRARKLAVGYAAEAKLLDIEELEVLRGQKIAIVGANGIGKTALLHTLIGEIRPLGGEVKLGANVELGCLSQTHDDLDANATALASVLNASIGCTSERGRALLGSLLLSGDDAFKTIAQLSGGQRSRVVLARLMAGSANVLVLDEPTNHLDIPSTEILQQVLQDYEGTVLFVSHDRYLVQAVATQVWALDDGHVHRLTGGWDRYVQYRAERRGASQPAPADQVAAEAKQQRVARYRQDRKRANELQRLQRRHEQLEAEIDQLERHLAGLHKEISAAGEAGDMPLIESLGQQYSQADARLKACWTEWEQVGEQLGA